MDRIATIDENEETSPICRDQGEHPSALEISREGRIRAIYPGRSELLVEVSPD